ncbi:MAG TPA: cytochrome C oxidase subunit IV family protein [Candidatus Limnocylindrales bacterium]|nr:cytochrome C oxidase subunit IV family protein [Candidatus Limnocylindrales bacterium]
MVEHVESKKVYFTVFVVLMVLTFITIQVAFMDLGWLNNILALGIAVCKATLVALFFMHVRYSTRLTWVVILGGLFWLGIMIALTLSDYLTRSWLTYPGH